MSEGLDKIGPLPDDVWTHGHRTNLRLNKDMFASSGAPPWLLLPALMEPGLVWYSTIIEYDIRMVALPELEAARLPIESYPNDGPIASRIKDLYPVTEYKLNEAVAST